MRNDEKYDAPRPNDLSTGRLPMPDITVTKAMLDRAGIRYTQGEAADNDGNPTYKTLNIDGDQARGRSDGYAGFGSTLVFDEQGRLVNVAASEG